MRQTLLNAGYRSVVVSLEADMVRNVRAALRLLWVAALFVLLIAAVNIANLALVRTGRRLKELAAVQGLPELSMGTSQDYRVAVEEGATLIRVGSALWEE